MPVTINGTAGITFNDATTQATALAAPNVSAGTIYQIALAANLNSGTSSTSYILARQTMIRANGSVRVQWSIYDTQGQGSVFGRIYKNGVAFGPERGSIGAVFTDDVTVSFGDLVQLYIRVNNAFTQQAFGDMISIGATTTPFWPISIGVA
jgi:hypothetical protein